MAINSCHQDLIFYEQKFNFSSEADDEAIDCSSPSSLAGERIQRKLKPRDDFFNLKMHKCTEFERCTNDKKIVDANVADEFLISKITLESYSSDEFIESIQDISESTLIFSIKERIDILNRHQFIGSGKQLQMGQNNRCHVSDNSGCEADFESEIKY